jgi:uncharacterized protein YidB (DUF937 family)
MGIIDRVTTEVSQLLDRSQSPMLGDLLSYLSDPTTTGLHGVLQRLRNHGYHEAVVSWVGRGANQPLTAAQFTLALGPQIRALAIRTAQPPERVASQLARLLPLVVDLLTPNGRLPEPSRAGAAIARLAPLAQPHHRIN